ncbi:MAG: hypothetical protein IPL79_00260 [Myxococcales bacterium]|nr:hypothetical protein [Myxococcales bacterium]
MRAAHDATPIAEPSQVAKAAPSAARGKRVADTHVAVALDKGTDRSTVHARYATAKGELEMRFNGEATIGDKTYKIIGKTTDAQYVLRDAQGALVAFTRKNATHGTLRRFKLAANQFIEGDRLLRIEGTRIRHTPHNDGILSYPDAGFVAPDGTHIMQKWAGPQAAAPSQVAFAQDEQGVYYAHLTWETDGSLVALKVPSQSLLAADGTEYRAQQAPFEVFVGVSKGDVLQYRKGKIARPPPDTTLNGQEFTLKDGIYGAVKEVDAKDGSKQLLVVNRFGVPFSMATNTKTGLSPRTFAVTDFADGTGIGKDNVIETTTQIQLPDFTLANVPAAVVLLGSGKLASGLVVERTPNSIVLQRPRSAVHRLLIRHNGDWHEAATNDRFVDDKGMAWRAFPVGGKALDGAPTQVIATAIVGKDKKKTTAMFTRSLKGTQWVYEPAPEGSVQTTNHDASTYISNGEAYRIVAKPLTAAKLADDLEAMFNQVGQREAPTRSTSPIRTALQQMGIDGPNTWAAQSARILPQLRQGVGPDVAKISPDVMQAVRRMLNPTADEFPFAIGVKSNVIGTPRSISQWGATKSIDVADYHPADLAFFHVAPSGTLRPASLGELRAYFDATLGQQKPLVHYSDLARPAGLEIVTSVDELTWDAALMVKARQAVSTLRLGETDKIVVAYDACGNVEARPLHTEAVQDGHPTPTQWRDWLAELPLLATLQSDAFAHSAKKNNGSWGLHVWEGPQVTKMGFIPGGYNKYTWPAAPGA